MVDLATVTRILARPVRAQPAPAQPARPGRGGARGLEYATTAPTARCRPRRCARSPRRRSTAGFAAGAARGHQLAAATVRDAVAEALAREPLGRRWALVLPRRHPRRRPARPPRTSRARPFARVEPVAQLGGWRNASHQLATAVQFGLGSGWRAGHGAATQALVEDFIAAVVDQIGREAVITTFLVRPPRLRVARPHRNPVHTAAEARPDPPAAAARPGPPRRTDGRPARPAGRSAPLTPGRPAARSPGARPPAGPGRTPRRSR